jgi:hypothetical protein
VWLEGLGKLQKSIRLIRTQTHDVVACSIMLQSSTLLRASTDVTKVQTGKTETSERRKFTSRRRTAEDVTLKAEGKEYMTQISRAVFYSSAYTFD